MGNGSLFQLPDELVITALAQAFPSREPQIRALATLVHPSAAPCRNLVLYGTESTGKSSITAALLAALESDIDDNGPPGLKFAIVNCVEYITGRHLFETVVGKVASALRWDGAPLKCETVSQLTVALSKMLKYTPRPDNFRFVLVFDGIDRQREAPPNLLPALARLSEIIPSITTVFIATSPPANFLHTPFVAHIHFPNYTKPEFVAILGASPPGPLPNTTQAETTELWTRFTAAVHDALARAASRTLPSLRHACQALWPRFTAPILAGTHVPREFSKLLVAARVHFHDERLLDPGIVSAQRSQPPPPPTQAPTTSEPSALTNGSAITTAAIPKPTQSTAAAPDLAALLPTTARLLLLAAYLASHNAARHDLTLFSTHHHGRRRRRGGLSVGVGRGHAGRRSKHRKIARKLLGAHAFVLERMLAIFASVRREWDAASAASLSDDKQRMTTTTMDSDIGMAIATLASLRLLVRVGGGAAGNGDPMDRGGKWRVNVGWEVVRALGRSIGVEIEDWLIE
ncbi:origin recognition complex subunit 5 C-terminus-domain-containing protein [Podospora appendiculata]|uniref:Origin recognition complex subunit 5 C-terminus-domain-containing protein n=1 Tax=Podospora appendiculata TaxID=314037 RepID=A0AAE1C909_9PEZI|nr:origin recognition complex subunit 5 C-terminus-domain-containing protein [Podospora appendiculata]